MRFGSLVLVVALAGCAQPPTKEVEMAAARVAKARGAGASVYATELMEDAELAIGQSRQALGEPGRYLEAIQAAALACIRADEALAEATHEREKIARMAHRLVREAEALIEEAISLGAARFGKPELDSFSERRDQLRSALEVENVSEVGEGAKQLKAELLDYLRKLKER